MLFKNCILLIINSNRMKLKIKSVREAYAANPETYAVTTNKETIETRPNEAVKEINVEYVITGVGDKPAYIGRSFTGAIVFHVFTDAATVRYFTK